MIELAKERVKEARLKNKIYFDKTHRLRPISIKEGDWVLILEDSLNNQHSSQKKFARRWRGPYVVTKVHNNATYSVRELDGAEYRTPYAGKRVKLFKRRVGFGRNEALEDYWEDSEDIDENKK